MTAKPDFLKNNRLFFVFVLIAVAGFFLWRLYSVQFQDPLEQILLDKPLSISAFSLNTADNIAFTQQQLKENWTFLFFGYTSCPDVCPTTLNEMASLKKLFTKPDEQKRIQIVFISVDPDRDTPEHLKSFVSYFDKTFIGATGTIEQLNTLTDQVRVKHKRLKKQGDEYLVEHSAAILLFNPQAQLIAKFPVPHYSEDIFKYFNQIRALKNTS